MHHSPIIYLAKFGAKGLLVAGALFVAVNPVTWGVGLALFDHFTGSERGAKFLGHGEPVSTQQSGTCQLHVNGHTFIVAADCSRVVFPGPKRPV